LQPFEHDLNKKLAIFFIPAKRWPGFLFRSPKVIIKAEGKGQTRNWLIIAPLPAGKSMANDTSSIRKIYNITVFYTITVSYK
jgi:hypothetical protein